MTRIKLLPVLFGMALLIGSCKGKKKLAAEADNNFPVLAFIQSQVADIDTSMYSITRIIAIDSLPPDTSYVRREEFKTLAADFLNIPDIAGADFAGRFKEDKQFDETLNRTLFTYTPIEPSKEEIQREEVLTNAAGDRVTNIIINRVQNSRDSSVEKKMLWQIDRSFQVVTTRQLPGQPATISTLRVLWNGDEGQ